MGQTGDSKMNLSDKLKEAHAYAAHDLFAESIEIYEQILETMPDLSIDEQHDIDNKINDLKHKIETKDKFENKAVTSQDVALLKETLSPDESMEAILDSARSFKELGLYKESYNEYCKLINIKNLNKVIKAEIIDCLFASDIEANIPEKLKNLIMDSSFDNAQKAELGSDFARILEKKDHKSISQELYSFILNLNPENQRAKSKIKAIEVKKTYDSKYSYLLQNEMVTKDQLQEALTQSKKTKKSVEFILQETFHIDLDDIGKSLSVFYGCPFTEYNSEITAPYEFLANLKKAYLIQNSWVPVNWEISTGTIDILIDDPNDLNKTDSISVVLKTKKITFLVGIKEDIVKIINQSFDSSRQQDDFSQDDSAYDELDMISDIDFEEIEDEEVQDDEVDEASGQIVRMVDQIIISAYRKQASDIHIEPSPIIKKTTVRYRIDGVCREVMRVPNSTARGILSRLKIMAKLDIAERRLPQDGKIKFKRKGVRPFEMRLATLPTAGGFEDAVLRILAESGAMKLDDMGLIDRNLNILKTISKQPYGLILVVGPTGSGKTTTLHSALGHINVPGIKIWTAEDPVEISQQGLRQVECNSKIGLDFARVMRSFLRADPDIIMIGEMRDYETASIGIEASLTGHLVLSTLHTNSAPETVTRLLDMGMDPFNFADALLGVLAQRLVRTLCKNCREKYHPARDEFDALVRAYEGDFDSLGFEYNDEFFLYRPKGCPMCGNSGYRGRTAIHELLVGTDNLKSLIQNRAKMAELRKQAIKDGMTTLMQDGIRKVCLGLTDLIQVRRVCIK